MDLKKIFNKECCISLKESKKTEILIEMIDCIIEQNLAQDGEILKQEIFYREQLMSTGIGVGIAIPHVRYKGVTEPVAALGVSPSGIFDYESIDDEPVKLVIMIIVGENQHKQHIRLLSQIMGRLKEQESRDRLINATTPEEMFELITGGKIDE